MSDATVNSSAKSNGQPSAPQRVVKANVTGPDSYETGGYDMSDEFGGLTVVYCPYVPTYDASELRWARIENVSGSPMLKFYDNDNGAPGSETTATDDCSGHTLDIAAWCE